MSVRAFWFNGDNNFGDVLTPWIIGMVTRQTVEHTSLDDPHPKYIVCGSILNHADEDCVVWGAGIADITHEIHPRVDIRAVRGPLSRARALQCGAHCPDVFGDPALLLPRLYDPQTQRNVHRLGVVAHTVDRPRVDPFYAGRPGVTVINIQGDTTSVIDSIVACEAIVSSTLHGLIVAIAYGIPALWVEFSDDVIGDGTKFKDFYMSLPAMPPNPPNYRSELPSVEALCAAVPKEPLEVPKILLDRLWEAKPFR